MERERALVLADLEASGELARGGEAVVGRALEVVDELQDVDRAARLGGDDGGAADEQVAGAAVVEPEGQGRSLDLTFTFRRLVLRA